MEERIIFLIFSIIVLIAEVFIVRICYDFMEDKKDGILFILMIINLIVVNILLIYKNIVLWS